MLKIDCVDRWQAYFRLRELGIPCRCQAHHPLEVEVSTPQSVVQLHSVLRQLTHSRSELASGLESCWTLTPQT